MHARPFQVNIRRVLLVRSHSLVFDIGKHSRIVEFKVKHRTQERRVSFKKKRGSL